MQETNDYKNTYEYKQLVKMQVAIAEGNQALARDIRNSLVNNHMGLVTTIAKKYAGKSDLEDIIQAGVIGLINAIDNYDLTKGVKLYTYASYWIKKEAILQACTNRNMNTQDNKLIQKYNKAKNEGLGEENIQELLGLSRSVYNKIVAMATNTVPLDTPVTVHADDGYEITVGDILEDLQINPIEECETKIFVDDMLKILPEKVKGIIKSYYGIGCTPMTYPEVGEYYGITAQSAREACIKGLNSLRAAFRNKDTWRLYK